MQTSLSHSTRSRRAPLKRGRDVPPARTCVVCRRHADKAELWPTRGLRGVGSLDGALSHRGRGAYVCLDTTCLITHARRQGEARQGEAAARAWVHALALRRLLETLGLARRCGVLVHGVERVAQASEPGMSAYAASDMAPRSLRRLPHAKVFVDAHALGEAVGLPGVAALSIRPGRLCLQAASWFGVWYDTRTATLANINSHSAIEVAR